MVDLRRSLAAILALAVIAPLAACGDDPKPSFAEPAVASDASAAPVPESATITEPVALAVTPAKDKKNVPISTEIGLKVSGGEITSVTLTDAKGKKVAGDFREDGSAWVPGKPLKAKQKYAAEVVATGKDGTTTKQTTAFTTMSQPGRTTDTGLYLFDDHTYGVAMPIVVEFDPGIKKKDRAAVQKRLFVEITPAQPGTWSWTPSGTQAYYRAPEYWQTGTQIKVRAALAGLPTGDGIYGDKDRSATAKIGRSFEMKVDNKTKKMTVVRDGKTIKTMPVSLGKKSTPSSSGTMVVMQKMAQTVFDTTDTDGADGYRTEIEYAQRLTWSGQYIHSAPWSTGDQGRRNVSHGCVNVSPTNARWLFDKTLVGDPITVLGTGDKLEYGNGWTPWDLSWEEFVKGSALKVPASLG
ncbi:lipoprotein-anchoring transpeptidase ErfK/SrfK [Actinoplanes lutulentus]|uniref:Lipoprotein-anchoring transpeptidase ErfK/SrfK n=1 Tax=Actinoplanes lutulentus TaxID=1287878 RepID=A0A327ZFR5_9ACTN|nr:Ig-like domain-containing protein [Actinoplanes lutulentus]MBB2947974.1 lipoprotein-anchoring transpeptidase ErfK/SrfK [Actinoplanes lutulentus]RAK40145.1 lipoprotein-anchoring transpeptidase ErfK/SrfK [Actinoplanes lutulentus]